MEIPPIVLEGLSAPLILLSICGNILPDLPFAQTNRVFDESTRLEATSFIILNIGLLLR